MQIYLGYKFTKIPNKAQLIADVEDLAAHFTKQGHKVFVLGRDVHKWKNHPTNPLKSIVHMIKNIRKSDVMVAYITSDKKSHGLMTELVVARLLGKKIVHLIHEQLSTGFDEDKNTKVFLFKTVDDIKSSFTLKA